MRIGFGTTNFKVRRQKFGFVTLVFLCVIGVAFTSAGLFALNAGKIDPSWTKVSGEIVDSAIRASDGSTTYAPVVEYKANGQTYTVTGSISAASYPKIGSSRQVAYNPAQPVQAKLVETAKTSWFLYLFPAIGIALLLIAPIMFIRSLKRSGNIRQLMQSGQKLQGVLVDIQSGSGNRDSAYKIVVAATDPAGTVQHYTSDPLAGIAGLAMADFHNSPVPIDVYVDPANPANYYVDISDIPNLTPDRIAQLVKNASSNQNRPNLPG